MPERRKSIRLRSLSELQNKKTQRRPQAPGPEKKFHQDINVCRNSKKLFSQIVLTDP